MATVTLPNTLTPGTPEDVTKLMANLNALKDGVNTIDTAQIASGAVTTAKLASAVGNFGAWASYTPVWTGSVTNPTIGSNGSITGAYCQIGKTVFLRFAITFGSNTTYGSGYWRISVPSGVTIAGGGLIGSARAFDNGNRGFPVWVEYATSTTVQFVYTNTTTSGLVGAGVDSPYSGGPASGDYLDGFMIYETA